MNTLAGLLLAVALTGQAGVLTDTTLAFHDTPGVWFMLLRVDSETLDGMKAEVIAPSGKNLCPHPGVSDGRSVVETQCDCWALGMERREGDTDGWSAMSVGTWNPMRGSYRIRVRALLPCKISVSAGAKFSHQPHWAAADTLRVSPGEEYVWTARWGDVAPGDSTRVKLKRASGPRKRR